MQRPLRLVLGLSVLWTLAVSPSAALASRLGTAVFPDVVGFLVHTAEPDESRAQTFTLERSGILAEITLSLFDLTSPLTPGVGPLADPLVLELRSTENGIPLGAGSVLGAAELRRAELDLPRTEPLTFRFAPLGIGVSEGDVLAFVLGPGSGGAMTQLISLSGQEVYPGGSSFIARDFSDDFEDRGIDYDFEILVVPEPSTALLLGLGIAGLSGLRRGSRARRTWAWAAPPCGRRTEEVIDLGASP